MRFVTNLRPQTIESFAELDYRPQAWLLSTHRATPATLRLAIDARGNGLELMADNGTKPLIDLILAELAERGDAIGAELNALRRSDRASRRTPSRAEVPASLRRSARTLAADVLARVDELRAGIDADELLHQQLAMQPTALIAREDFAIGALLGLGLDRTVLDWPTERFTVRNRLSIDGWRHAVARVGAGVDVFVTLAADEYHTARAAAIEAARTGAVNVAVGVAGLNRDTTYTDAAFLAHRHRLPSPGPRRYVRLAEILLGLRDGFREAGVPLARFHGLGLGARGQFPLLAAALDPCTRISIDATSPLHDAVQDRVLYDPEQFGDRVSALDAVSRVLAGADWPLDSPFLRAARERLGHDPQAARTWAAGRREGAAGWDDLRPGEELATRLPVFASGRGSATSTQTGSWIGHNHWAIDRVVTLVPSDDRRAWGLERLGLESGGSEITARLSAAAVLAVLTIHEEVS